VRILFVAHGFPRHMDDHAGKFLLDLAQGQQALGHEVAAVVPHAAGLAERESLGGVSVMRFHYGPDATETLAYEGTMAEQVLQSWSARWRFVRFVLAMRAATRDAVRQWRPDVVHIHWWFPGGLAAWPGQVGVPVVLTSHGTDLFLADRSAPLRALARRVLPTAQQMTVISSPLAARARALGVAAERIMVVPMPAPVANAPPSAPPRTPVPGRMLFLGRLVARKGAHVALDALRHVAAAHPAAHLRIVGDGPERAALESRAQAAGVADRVTFVGAVPPSAVSAEYAQAAVFVMPAVTDWKGEQEGFGLVLVEAMRAGVPVVASASGGIPDVVRDGVTGRLVPEGDAAALATAVADVLSNPEAAALRAATAAQDMADRFSPEAIARTFHDVYQRAIA
jgi:glycosyltransferase involved in cell wall biosynthesis